ncbi:hypothetical protein BDV12DRAFT_205533 [Aspergillus spectabilis]
MVPVPCTTRQVCHDAILPSQSTYDKPQQFYPVRLYEILNNRYQIAAKIGWGTSSTVWLACDLHQYSQEVAEKELRITEHITKAVTQHPGRNFVATLLDSIRVASPGGTHICLVFDALCEPLWMLKRRFEANTIPLDVLKPMNDPSPRKQLDGRDIYLSRNYWGLSPDELGRLVITDFGLAVRGDGPPDSHYIQPEGYRAPEVSLGPVLRPRSLRTPPDSCGSGSSEKAHLGKIISLLGPPPPDLLSRGKETSRYFDAKGQIKFPELIGKKDLVSMAREIDDDQGMPQFDRTTAQDLLSHPWLPQMKPANG